MAVGKLNASPFYFAHLQAASLPRTAATASLIEKEQALSTSQTRAERIQEWILPVLTLIGTAAAMWFVVTDGWFQLFGFWS